LTRWLAVLAFFRLCLGSVFLADRQVFIKSITKYFFNQ